MIRKLRATPTAMGTKKLKSVSRKHSSADRQTDRQKGHRQVSDLKRAQGVPDLHSGMKSELKWNDLWFGLFNTHAPKVKKAICRGIVRHFGSDLGCWSRIWMLRLQLLELFSLVSSNKRDQCHKISNYSFTQEVSSMKNMFTQLVSGQNKLSRLD